MTVPIHWCTVRAILEERKQQDPYRLSEHGQRGVDVQALMSRGGEAIFKAELCCNSPAVWRLCSRLIVAEDSFIRQRTARTLAVRMRFDRTLWEAATAVPARVLV